MTSFGKVNAEVVKDDGAITVEEGSFDGGAFHLVEVSPREFRGVALAVDEEVAPSVDTCPTTPPIIGATSAAVQAATTFVAGVGEVALDGLASLSEVELARFLINEELSERNWDKAWKYFLDSKFTDFTFVFGKEVELTDVFLDDFNVSINLLRLGSERVRSKITLRKKVGFLASKDGHSVFTKYFEQAKSFEVS